MIVQCQIREDPAIPKFALVLQETVKLTFSAETHKTKACEIFFLPFVFQHRWKCLIQVVQCWFVESLQTVAMSVFMPFCIPDLSLVLCFVLFAVRRLAWNGLCGHGDVAWSIYFPRCLYVIFVGFFTNMLSVLLINICLSGKGLLFEVNFDFLAVFSSCPCTLFIARLMFVFVLFQVLSENNTHTRPGRLHTEQKLTTGMGKLTPPRSRK